MEKHGRWWHAPGRNVVDHADLKHGLFLRTFLSFSHFYYLSKTLLNRHQNLLSHFLVPQSTFLWLLNYNGFNIQAKETAASLFTGFYTFWQLANTTIAGIIGRSMFFHLTLMYRTDLWLCIFFLKFVLSLYLACGESRHHVVYKWRQTGALLRGSFVTVAS